MTPASRVRSISSWVARAARARPSLGMCRPPSTSSSFEQRVQLHALGGVDQPGLDAPRRRVAELALQLLEPLLGCRDLEPADLVEAAEPVLLQGEQLLHGVLREQGHRLRRVGLEYQTRRVGGRAAGHVERTLLDDGDVGPAAGDEFVGEVGPDDAGADDHDAWLQTVGERELVQKPWWIDLLGWSGWVSGRRRCWQPWSRMRCSQCQRTARESARHSASWPTVARVRRVVGVVDPDHLLLDDRALVEVGGDVVRRRADQLHAAVVRLVVRLRALEAGQERVVDVDRAALERVAEPVGEDLHVARQHHEVDVVLVDQFQQPRLGLRAWCPG